MESKKAPTIPHALESFKILSTHVNHSPLALEAFYHHCKEMGVSYVKPITPVATRRNSIAMMVKSILRLRVSQEAIKEEDTSLGCRILTLDDFEAIALVLPALEEMLQKFSHPTFWLFSVVQTVCNSGNSQETDQQQRS